jgi:hypothetical protein
MARAWSGPDALLDIGIGEAAIGPLGLVMGEVAALDRYRRFIPAFALAVHGLDPEDFGPDGDLPDAAAYRARIAGLLERFASRTRSQTALTFDNCGTLHECLTLIVGQIEAHCPAGRCDLRHLRHLRPRQLC